MNTQRYVELYTEIYGDLKPENYICEIAQDTKEAKKLIAQGFEYVTGTIMMAVNSSERLAKHIKSFTE
jgi:hypothetical protein